jgi:hypothetical protein
MTASSEEDQPTGAQRVHVQQPAIIDLDQSKTTSDFDSLTEATVKFEAPKAREARERREAADQMQKHRVELIKLSLASLLLLGFFGLGVYLFAFKPEATEAQKTLGTTILTAIVTGGVGYAFGKKENKSDKE